MNKPLYKKSCKHCHQDFTTSKPHQLYCCNACRDYHKESEQRKDFIKEADRLEQIKQIAEKVKAERATKAITEPAVIEGVRVIKQAPINSYSTQYQAKIAEQPEENYTTDDLHEKVQESTGTAQKHEAPTNAYQPKERTLTEVIDILTRAESMRKSLETSQKAYLEKLLKDTEAHRAEVDKYILQIKAVLRECGIN